MNLANPLSDLGKILLVIGIAAVAVGALLLLGVKLPFRLGRLPGDIAHQGRHGGFHFPITTCIVLSLALTLLMWIINLFPALTNWKPEGDFPHVPLQTRPKRSLARVSMDLSVPSSYPRG